MFDIEDNANLEWLRHVKLVREGKECRPRGILTREVLGAVYTIDMRTPVLTIPERKISLAFLAAEAAWILSGDNKVCTIAPYNKNISNFSDDGWSFFGAYGPPVREQLGYVVDTLCKDPDSRQALLTIWRPRPGQTLDVPCTVSLQFFIRDGFIHCVAYMRSSDAWLGIPYDQFNFSCIAAFVAMRILKKTGSAYAMGELTICVGSAHLYEKNFSAVDELIETVERRTSVGTNAGPEVELLLPEVWAADPEEFVTHLWRLADAIRTANFRDLRTMKLIDKNWLCDHFLAVLETKHAPK